jgi:predicted NUDIX family NTP pyrophosphohydrolase
LTRTYLAKVAKPRLVPHAALMSHQGALSSGTLLYRYRQGELEVLLVHPSGNFNRRAPWGIPKGQPDPGEELEAAARRETIEETGVVCGPLVDVGYIDYSRSAKRVHAFAGPAPVDAAPRCASWEVDKADFIAVSRARRIIHPDQAALLGRLERMLSQRDEGASPHESPAGTEAVANSNR